MALIGAFNRSDTLWRPSAVPIHLTDPTGAYGENPEWERSSRIHLLSVAKEDFLLRSGTKVFLHKHRILPAVHPRTPPVLMFENPLVLWIVSDSAKLLLLVLVY